MNGLIKFEGIYSNGHRLSGIGADYYSNGNKKFEGKYIGTEKSGSGKEYYQNGKLKFDGKYLNGKRWNGKAFSIKGDEEFEIKNGTGKIKEYYRNGNIKFKGEYLNGSIYGNGKRYYQNGNIKFDGIYMSGKKWTGKIYNYYGDKGFEIKEGEGFGKEFNDCGDLLFEGNFLNGEKWEGNIKKYYDNNNLEFEGEYSGGKENELGIEYYENGQKKFEGKYFKGKRLEGKLYYYENPYKVDYIDGKKIKKIKDQKQEDLENNKVIFVIDISNNNKEKGREYDNPDLDEPIFEGTYMNGRRWEGKGKEFYNNNNILFDGEY